MLHERGHSRDYADWGEVPFLLAWGAGQLSSFGNYSLMPWGWGATSVRGCTGEWAYWGCMNPVEVHADPWLGNYWKR